MKRIITKENSKTIAIDEVSNLNFIGVEWKHVEGRGAIVRIDYDKFIVIDLCRHPDHFAGSPVAGSKAECVVNEADDHDKEFYVFDSQKELLEWVMEDL